MAGTNLLESPKYYANKAVLAKLETGGYGVDALPTGLVDWMEMRNVSFTPMDVDKVDRNIEQPFFGSSGSVITGIWAKVSGDIALGGSGTPGVKPKYSPMMMAAGFAETITAGTKVEYHLVSRNISSATLALNMDGTLHKMPGARADLKCKMDAKGIPLLTFSFDTLYVAPVVLALPAVNRDGWTFEDGVNAANTGPATINGFDLAWSSLEWALGSKIGRVNLPGPQVEVGITGRAGSGSITVLVPELSDFDPFALAQTGAKVPLTVTHGTTPGKIVQTDMIVKLGAPEYTDVEGMAAYKIPLEIVPNVGNDEIVITLL